jgi:hypothetical protein
VPGALSRVEPVEDLSGVGVGVFSRHAAMHRLVHDFQIGRVIAKEVHGLAVDPRNELSPGDRNGVVDFLVSSDLFDLSDARRLCLGAGQKRAAPHRVDAVDDLDDPSRRPEW